MTIDEAINHAKEAASELKRKSGLCVQNDNECDKFSGCLNCAKEHEQLAKWLEIDDFIKVVDKHCGYYAGECKNLTRDDLLEIAEDLKNA